MSISTSIFQEVVPEIDANWEHKRLNLYTRALLLLRRPPCWNKHGLTRSSRSTRRACVASRRDVTSQVEFWLITVCNVSAFIVTCLQSSKRLGLAAALQCVAAPASREKNTLTRPKATPSKFASWLEEKPDSTYSNMMVSAKLMECNKKRAVFFGASCIFLMHMAQKLSHFRIIVKSH